MEQGEGGGELQEALAAAEAGPHHPAQLSHGQTLPPCFYPGQKSPIWLLLY